MPLTGNHIIGDPGHTSDHNTIDSNILAISASISGSVTASFAAVSGSLAVQTASLAYLTASVSGINTGISAVTYANIPASLTITNDYVLSSSAYSPRPTNRSDIIVRWRGPFAPSAAYNGDEYINTASV